MLRQGRKYQNAFHPGKTFPDTLPRPSAKGEIGEWRAGRFRLWGPALRVKALGIRVEAGIVVYHVRAHDDVRVWREHIATHFVGINRPPPKGFPEKFLVRFDVDAATESIPQLTSR